MDAELISVGLPAPDFTLSSATDEKITLSDYRDNKNIVLYFMREFTWMQCRSYSVQLARSYETLQEQDTEVLVIGGTASGICAGLQSSRLGVKTIIAESTPWLGGMLTAAGVSAFDGNRQRDVNRDGTGKVQVEGELGTHQGADEAAEDKERKTRCKNT